MEINEEHIGKLYRKHRCFVSDLEINLVSYNYSKPDVDEITVRSGNHSFCFLCNCKELDICHLDGQNCVRYDHQETFDGWRSLFCNLDSTSISKCTKAERTIRNLGFGKAYFKSMLFNFLEEMFSLIEGQSNNLKKGVNLIPLSKDSQINHMKNQNWYNKLLEEYTQYYQSGSKSDIADKHYQEQAKLHGLKFVVR